jgi:hypothetical protein
MPLYDHLLEKVKTGGIICDPNKLDIALNKISELPPDAMLLHARWVTALIVHHEFLTQGSLLGKIPINFKQLPGNKGYKVAVASLPQQLQQILRAYADKYSEP